MAKKASSKDKKAARKAETERLKAIKAQLNALNAADNLLAGLPAFASYARRGLAAQLLFYRSSDLPPPLLDWALRLTERHMRPLYEAAEGWGWSEDKKREELAHEDARFVVVTAAEPAPGAAAPATGGETAAAAEAAVELAAAATEAVAAPEQHEQEQQQQLEPGQPLAFMHFRFEDEEGEPVAYLYEIQVEAAAQGRGLGAHLMRLLELLAFRAGLPRVMLTVFHANASGMALYRKLGYVTDGSSPELHDPEGGYPYTIMTKRRSGGCN